ncbi:MAG: carotenoid biosynthesis protein [Caldilineaceae bacterium SB0670_bin_27]|nr:carotenoid biosynthesis protein [Caldilineaceae bacterium SB0670_bin_27]
MKLSSRILFCLWLLLMILIPHILRLGGRPTLLIALSLSILVQAGLVLDLLVSALRGRVTLRIGIIIVAVAWTAEFIGHNTGLPFGKYAYTQALQPQIGNVPVQVPVAWLMMLPPAWAVGRLICQGFCRADFSYARTHKAASSFVSGLAFAAWDLFLDPQMVKWNLWRWESPGVYFGIPVINFIGWTIVATVVIFGLSSLAPSKALPLEALLLVYTTVWLLNSVGLGLYFELPGAAAAGFLGMGLVVALAWRQVLASNE